MTKSESIAALVPQTYNMGSVIMLCVLLLVIGYFIHLAARNKLLPYIRKVIRNKQKRLRLA